MGIVIGKFDYSIIYRAPGKISKSKTLAEVLDESVESVGSNALHGIYLPPEKYFKSSWDNE
jgi:hypothetical protein